MQIEEINGYAALLKYRQKYKTLENVTRKQDFKLDHRLKVIDGPSKFLFSMDEGDRSQYFFSSRSVKVEVEEIFTIEDW